MSMYIVYVCEDELSSRPVRILARCESLANKLKNDLQQLGYIVSVMYGEAPTRTPEEIEKARQYTEEAMDLASSFSSNWS